MLYSLKLSRILPIDRNRPDVVERRHDYANWFLEEANIHHPVFIDECGFNIWTARSQGQARVKADFHSVQNVARSTFSERFLLNYKQSSGTNLISCG